LKTHAIDSELYKDLYGNKEIREIFSDKSLLKKWIEVELALAKAQTELGMIPEEAFKEIENKADINNFNIAEIRKGIEKTSHPLISFIRQYSEICENGAGEYVHFGATTQDIMDTGLILQLKDGYHFIESQLDRLLDILIKLTKENRDVPMAGRTHGQHALPITLGFKMAQWLSEFERHRKRMNEIYDRVFVGQLGGAVGTLASIEEDGLKVQKRMMEILGLNVADIPWHTSRDNLVELASVYALIAGTIGKIANEIINLQRTEIAEIEEGFQFGKVGSSTMPHKRNPMICEYIVGLSRLVRLQMASVYDVLIQEHERDMGLWLVEWEVWPEITVFVSKIIESITVVLSNLIIHKEKMSENLELTGGLIMSEHMMFVLSPYVGKQTAHEIVYEVCMEAYEKGIPVIDVFAKNDIVRQYLSEEEIRESLNPGNYLGLSKNFVDKVLNNFVEMRD
jgi:adenylosuccinate lyase